MDVKTLSTIIGHVSSSTTLNVYAHVTDEMRRTAAVKIDQNVSQHLRNLLPAPSKLTKVSGVRRGPDASLKSMTICGRADTPRSGRTAKSILETLTLTVKRNVKNNWQR